jgi:AcrR family transcriptional regulator
MTLSLRDTKRSLTEQAIVEKAVALFRQYGFDKVSVRQIARAALVSQKTVFNYFPYKELIVMAAAQPRLVAFVQGVQKLVDDAVEPAEALRKFSDDLAELCLVDQTMTGIVLSELLTLDAERLALTMRYVPDFRVPIRTAMVLARAQGQLRPDVSVEYASEFFVSSMLNVLRTCFTAGQTDRVPPMLNVTLEIILHGAFKPAAVSERSDK